MIRNKGRMRLKGNKISIVIIFLLLSFVFFTISTYENSLIVEGSYVFKEQETSILADGERGSIRHIQDDIAFLAIKNTSQEVEETSSLLLVNIQQPANPIRLGRFELTAKELLLDVIVEDNTAYLLRGKTYFGIGNWTLTLLNITEPANPVLLSSTVAENVTHAAWDSWDFTIHNNYLYVCTDSSLEIFDCSNLSLPVKVANHTSSGGEMYINNNYLYLVSAGVKIYDLTDPLNPVLLGEVNSTKHTPAGSGVFGKYIIRAFYWSGLQVYNCTNPLNPSICGDYNFPQREIQPGGQIHDVEIVGNKLFAGGRKLYVFDLSNPQNLKRIAQKNIGSRDTYAISVTENYIFATILNDIIVYSFVENFFGRNIGLGLGIGFGLPLLVVGSLLILRKKKRS